jgi:hypothetical protein
MPRKTTSTLQATLRNSLKKRVFWRHNRTSCQIYRRIYQYCPIMPNDQSSEQIIDLFQITVHQLLDFLVFLFEVKDLSPSTHYKGLGSAISRTIYFSRGPKLLCKICIFL